MTDGIKDTIGCDLGDKFSDLFILTANGETQVPERLKTTQAGVKKFGSLGLRVGEAEPRVGG